MSEKCFDHARAGLTAAAPHMSGVKVKQLEWEPIIRGGKDQQAKCSLGKYVISVDNFQTGSTHYIWVAGQSDDEEHKYECETMAEAKAVAQADFEKRFWAMADITALGPPSAREQALEEAAGIARHFKENAYSDGMSEEVVMARSFFAHDIETAIRSLKSQPAPQTGGGE